MRSRPKSQQQDNTTKD